MLPLNIHPLFILLLLAIVLIIFGPGKLPEVGGAIGRSIREFRKASSDLTGEVKQAIETRGREDVYPGGESPQAESSAPEAEKPSSGAQKK